MSWTGLDAFYSAIQKVSEDADKAAKKLVSDSAAVVTRAAQQNFQGSHKAGQPHVGGDLPNIVTGNLRRSIRMQPIEHAGVYEYSTQVGPTAIYGRRVELGYLGTRGYPYFMPAATVSQPIIAALSEKAWAEFFRP